LDWIGNGSSSTLPVLRSEKISKI